MARMCGVRPLCNLYTVAVAPPYPGTFLYLLTFAPPEATPALVPGRGGGKLVFIYPEHNPRPSSGRRLTIIYTDCELPSDLGLF